MSKFEKVLLVDDDEITNFINQSLIDSLKIAKDVLVFNNAKDALTAIQKYCTSETKEEYNLIFLDLNMPLLDGAEFLKELNKLNTTYPINLIPIVLTNTTHPNKLESIKSLGAVHTIQKPLTEGKINLLMKELDVLNSY